MNLSQQQHNLQLQGQGQSGAVGVRTGGRYNNKGPQGPLECQHE